MDYILEIIYGSDPATDEDVQARLFLTQSTGNFSTDAGGETTVTAFFESAGRRAAAMSLFDDLRVRAEDRERIDWLDRYEQSLEPLRIGKSFVVAPDARLIASEETRHRIIVPQEQAFGTGSHETTSLCIEMLELADVRGKRGLDVGSGSGILAIAMLRLGAAKAIAFDNDPDAYGPLRDNCIRNGVSMPLFIGGVEALRGGTFDIVTMNIIPEVILPLLPSVMKHVSGDLILSGILTTRRDEVVRAAAANGAALRDEGSKGEWWCGVFGRSRN
jgi:ribosomal protein L11 methyltransferase